MKDYYRILQIDSKATPEEIKKAYRKLAKKYHPDKNANKDAGKRFKEVSIAYSVLSCPKHRNIFDADLKIESLLKSQGSSFVNIVSSNCDECSKTGFVLIQCAICVGAGQWYEKRPYGKTKVKSKFICTICKGTGKISHICFGCAGTGKIRKFKK